MVLVLVLGAGGIIGSHMRVSQPEGVTAVYTRRSYGDRTVGFDLDAGDSLDSLLDDVSPDAIVNLAGESRPDVVERNPGRYSAVNVALPTALAAYCARKNRHYVHVSTQAVFGGYPHLKQSIPGLIEHFSPPYGPNSPRQPANQYGLQKLMAETHVQASGKNWTIVRPTFVLGVRPLLIGRENPVEQMLAPVQSIAEGETAATQRQVCDRWFSVSFADDVADILWYLAQTSPCCAAIHVGIPFRTNRHIIASYLRPDINIEPVSHDSFEGLAPRPIDTTYAGDGGSFAQIAEGLDRCKAEYEARMCAGVAK